MDEKDFFIKELKEQLKVQEERNKKLLDKIKELTATNIVLSEKLMGY